MSVGAGFTTSFQGDSVASKRVTLSVWLLKLQVDGADARPGLRAEEKVLGSVSGRRLCSQGL